MGVGIMTSGSTTTHGAGPSGHSTVARILSTTLVPPPQTETDSSAENGAVEPPDSKSPRGPEDMDVDKAPGLNP